MEKTNAQVDRAAGFRMGLCAGVLAGLVEAALFLTLQASGRIMFVSPSILWIAPAADVVLFAVAGLCVATIAPLFRRVVDAYSLTVFALAFLAWSDWLALVLSEYLHPIALALLAAGLAVQTTRVLARRRVGVMQPLGPRAVQWTFGVVLVLFAGTEGMRRVGEARAESRLPAASPGAPNVMVVIIDALRADHLATYGYSRETSPTIDSIARAAVVFDNAFSTASYSLASHASLLTGWYPYQHHAEWNSVRALISCACPTLAETMRAHGYRTGAFSANRSWFTREFGFARGFIRFEDYFHSLPDMFFGTVFGRVAARIRVRMGFEDLPARKRAIDVTDAVVAWVKRSPAVPFLAVMNYFDVHDPYLPPQPYRGQFAGGRKVGGKINEDVHGYEPHLTPQERQSEIDAYDGGIAYVDHELARLLDVLARLGVAQNTLVVITSDHGESFGEHDRYLHGHSLGIEAIHVPLVFSLPRRLPRGVRMSAPVSLASMPATVEQIAGISDDAGLSRAASLVPWWTPGSPPVDTVPALAELDRRPWAPKRFPSTQGRMRSLVTDRWQLIEHQTLGTELYDWHADPAEQVNLTTRPELRGIIDGLVGELKGKFGTPGLFSGGTRHVAGVIR